MLSRSALPRVHGFTLVELTVVVAVAALLATLSYPMLAGVVRRIHRADALTALAQVQLLQQRHRSVSTRFATLEQIGVPGSAAGGRYRLEASTPSASGYVLIAQAQGAQARDAACRVLRIEVSGADVQRSSGPDADTRNPAPQNGRCWGT